MVKNKVYYASGLSRTAMQRYNILQAMSSNDAIHVEITSEKDEKTKQ